MSVDLPAQALPVRKFGEPRRLPAVSVVVVVGGEPEPLRHCLAALLQQDFFSDCFEIITVDPDALDSVREVVIEAAHRAAGTPSVQYLITDGDEGLAASRNRGWMYSRGAVLAFIDADVVPAPDWLRRGLAALEPGVAAVHGRVRVELPDIASDEEREIAALAARGLAGSNSFVHRLALIAIGGFDERFSAAWHSDADLQFMLIEHFRDRQRVRPEALSEVLWHPRPVGWDASLRRQRWHQFDELLRAKHPALYHERFGGVGSDVFRGAQLAMVGLLVLASAAVLVANFAAAAAALALWTTVTAGLCVRRLIGSHDRPHQFIHTVLTASAVPLLAVFWRCVGALRFRVKAESRIS